MLGKTQNWMWVAAILMGCWPALAQNPGAASQPGQAASQAGQDTSQVGQDVPGAVPSTDESSQVDDRLQTLSSTLNLTDDQKEKVKPILQGEVEKLTALRGDSSMSTDEKEAQAKQVHASVHSQIASILTPEQQQKFEQMENDSGQN
jgi:Spy/CpxP family protein refolding chaperone